jgi:hypothetical protein
MARSRGLGDVYKRQRLIGQPRADVRKVSKGLKSKLAEVSKAIGAEADKAVAAYDDLELLITPQIQTREAQLEEEREEKARIERERIAGLDAKLASLAAWIDRCKEPGMTAERIANGIKALNDSTLDPADWQEYLARAQARRDEVLDVMRQIHSDTLAAEMRAAELERQREENARIAAELAERQRVLDEQAAELARAAAELNSQRQVSGAQTDPNATGNGNMAHQTDDAAPVGGPAEGEGASALSPGSGEQPDEGVDEVSPERGAIQAPHGEDHQRSASDEGNADREDLAPTSSDFSRGPVRPAHESGMLATSQTGGFDPVGHRVEHPSIAGVAAGTLHQPYDGPSLETSEREAVAPTRIILAGPEPEDDDEGGIDLLLECLSLIKELRKPYGGRFPSQPKPAPEWWADVRQRIDALEPTLLKAVAVKRGA